MQTSNSPVHFEQKSHRGHLSLLKKISFTTLYHTENFQNVKYLTAYKKLSKKNVTDYKNVTN